ncbi:MAG: TetR family transcriptional regulator [Alphaproteobacteria bacterium]|nr:TetR family transcriptional regulator [Alphaproteobacteria bacterium]
MSAKKKKDENPKAQIVQAALDLAVERGWEQTSLRDIAEKAGLSLTELFDHVEDKTDILVLLGRQIDRKVIENMSPTLSEESVIRDRLFDVMMDRYDALNDHREGIKAILESFKYDPKQAVISLPHLCRSMAWMMEGAGIDTNGISGAVKVTGLTGIYVKVLKTWMEDETSDLSKTMAALDKALERSERVANMIGL